MKYTVQTPIKRDGKMIPVGKTVDLDDDEAAPLLKVGAISDGSEKKPEPQNAGPSEGEADELLKIAQGEVEEAQAAAEKAQVEAEQAKADLAKAQDEIKSLTDKLKASEAEVAKLKKPSAPKGGAAKE